MREIRPSGSEGGGTELNRFSLPLSLLTSTIPCIHEPAWHTPHRMTGDCTQMGEPQAIWPSVCRTRT